MNPVTISELKKRHKKNLKKKWWLHSMHLGNSFFGEEFMRYELQYAKTIGYEQYIIVDEFDVIVLPEEMEEVRFDELCKS